MSNNSLTNKSEWADLQKHYEDIKLSSISEICGDSEDRFEQFSQTCDGLFFDYSKNLLTSQTMDLLIALARSCNLEERRDQMFAGAPINTSEDRAVLHTALRGSTSKDLVIDDESVSEFVEQVLSMVESISETIRADEKITNIVNIGIGGSDLGPHMVYEALKPFSDGPKVHFVSNIDGAHLSQTLQNLNPATTIIVIASKTFTTLETMTNAATARRWLTDELGADAVADHFIGVTTNEQAALDFGITQTHILPLRDWIGGRYSLWSAIGLSIAIACGYKNFTSLLAGAHYMDEHFKTVPLEENLPVLMAMVGIWNRNFNGHGALSILPYASNLHGFPKYIQQLDMESNGKSVNRSGEDIDHKTSPIIFGEPGTDGQHAFFQLLHQGTTVVPCDFIMALDPEHSLDHHHKHLLANALAQSEALMKGNDKAEGHHQKFNGNRPSNSIILQRLDPYHLGMLLALYEHKVFVQGVIWDINSFDQWGVELGKKLAKNITEALDKKQENTNTSKLTQSLLSYILQNKNSKNS